MMIRDISNFVRDNRSVPLKELAQHFSLDEAIAADILQRLVDKGRIRELEAGTSCSGGCTQCAPETVRIFAWEEKKPV